MSMLRGVRLHEALPASPSVNSPKNVCVSQSGPMAPLQRVLPFACKGVCLPSASDWIRSSTSLPQHG